RADGPRRPPRRADRARSALGRFPGMLRFAVDEINTDRVLGWAYDPDAPPQVTILIDGEPVGDAVLGAFRIDVARSLQDDRAEQSGFEFRFRPDHFDHVSGNRASVAVRVR